MFTNWKLLGPCLLGFLWRVHYIDVIKSLAIVNGIQSPSFLSFLEALISSGEGRAALAPILLAAALHPSLLPCSLPRATLSQSAEARAALGHGANSGEGFQWQVSAHVSVFGFGFGGYLWLHRCILIPKPTCLPGA